MSIGQRASKPVVAFPHSRKSPIKQYINHRKGFIHLKSIHLVINKSGLFQQLFHCQNCCFRTHERVAAHSGPKTQHRRRNQVMTFSILLRTECHKSRAIMHQTGIGCVDRATARQKIRQTVHQLLAHGSTDSLILAASRHRNLNVR